MSIESRSSYVFEKFMNDLSIPICRENYYEFIYLWSGLYMLDGISIQNISII